MTTNICTDDVIVHIATPQLVAGDGGGGRVAAAGGAELGRRLLLAARAGDTHAVLDLMAKGAPFTTDWLGTSPLHLAAANAHVETCSVLLRAGVSRDARTKVERTPLHLAAHAGHARVVRLLLDHGANVDCRDMLRMTPLHWAAAKGHEAAVKELLKRGADPRATCKFKKTPRCLALRAQAPRLAKVLEEALARAEIAASLRQIVPDSVNEEPEHKEFATLQRIQEGTQIKVKQQLEKNIKTEPKAEVRGGSGSGGGGAGSGAGAGAGGGGGAEALLRRHGITLLPTDDGSTVLSALQSGRTVVLSDAGKLMLKESGSNAASPRIVATSASAAAPVPSGADVAGVGANAKAPKAVKLFTVNNLSAIGAHVPATPIRKLINPQDLQQVKIVQLSSEAKGSSTLRERRRPPRPPVKILMNKTNFDKLMASANKTTRVKIGDELESGPAEPAAAPAQGDAVESSPEKECACGCGCCAKLASAQRALRRLADDLGAARARLASYERHSDSH